MTLRPIPCRHLLSLRLRRKEVTAASMYVVNINLHLNTVVYYSSQFDTKSCSFSGSGNIRYTATGWVWFNYDSKTKGHYKCASDMLLSMMPHSSDPTQSYLGALNIDETLKNIDDRSSTMNFAASGNIVTKSKYKGVCDKSKAKASKSKAKKQ